MRHRGNLAGAVALAILAVVVLHAHREDEPDPLSSCTFVNMRAWLGNSPRHLPDLPHFDVPADQVEQIRASLEPAVPEPHALKWQVFGGLDCDCADGSKRRVSFYTTGDPGAFSVEGRRRRYYRGGTDAGIEDAVRAAYSAAKKEAAP